MVWNKNIELYDVFHNSHCKIFLIFGIPSFLDISCTRTQFCLIGLRICVFGGLCILGTSSFQGNAMFSKSSRNNAEPLGFLINSSNLFSKKFHCLLCRQLQMNLFFDNINESLVKPKISMRTFPNLIFLFFLYITFFNSDKKFYACRLLKIRFKAIKI